MPSSSSPTQHQPTIAFTLALLSFVLVVFASGRLDVPLHLAGWLLFGSHAAGIFKAHRFLTPIVGPVQWTAEVVVDILPDSPVFVLVLSTLATLAAMGMLSDESSQKAHRGSWVAFCIVRALLPVSLAGLSGQVDNSVLYICYAVVTALSLMGPTASWPARSFAIADAGYAFTTSFQRPATESAVVAILLCFSHDFVARYLLHFLEAAAFTVAAIFISQITFVVVSDASTKAPMHDWTFVLNPWDAPDFVTYLSTRAPPVILMTWAIGIHIRTLTQGRTSDKVFFKNTVMALVVGLGLLAIAKDPVHLARKPSFAAVVSIAAMALSTFTNRSNRRRIAPNEWISATGFFSFDAVFRDSVEDENEKHDDVIKQLDFTGTAAFYSGESNGHAASSSSAAVQPPRDKQFLIQELEKIQDLIYKYKQREFRQEAIARAVSSKPEKDQAFLEIEKWKEQGKRAQQDHAEMEKELVALG